MSEYDDAQDPLLDELRSLFADADPVPPAVTQAARAALGWRRLDADLAELLADSALDTQSPALARTEAATLRSVSFGAAELTVDLEIRAEDTGRSALGQCSPAGRFRIELQTPDQAAAAVTESDSLGRFRLSIPEAAAFRLRVSLPASDRRREPNWVETSWIPV